MSNKTNKLNYSFALSINEPIGTNVDNGILFFIKFAVRSNQMKDNFFVFAVFGKYGSPV